MSPAAWDGQTPVSAVDMRAVGEWMAAQHIGSGHITDVHAIGGGTQNIMLQFHCDGRGFVLRRGPLHLRTATNDNLRREIRLLSALSATSVPHAKLIGACVDEAVLDGAVFYLMEPIDGFNAVEALPDAHGSTPGFRHRMGISMVEALAELSVVDYRAAGLGDFGRPDGFLDRQVPRWTRELESYSSLDKYPGHNFPLDQVADWLRRRQPASGPVGIMHGDLHLANVMFDNYSPEVAAIVDWEMTTIGDPLLDLGWMLATWPAPDTRQDMLGSAVARAGGLPTAAELISTYGDRTGYDVSAIDWYTVLACFKLGILLEGTYARSCAGKAPAAVGQRLHATGEALFARALTLIN